MGRTKFSPGTALGIPWFISGARDFFKELAYSPKREELFDVTAGPTKRRDIGVSAVAGKFLRSYILDNPRFLAAIGKETLAGKPISKEDALILAMQGMGVPGRGGFGSGIRVAKPLYSRVEKFLSETPAKEIKGLSLLNQMKKAGVTPDELKYTNVSEILAKAGQRKVNPKEVLNKATPFKLSIKHLNKAVSDMHGKVAEVFSRRRDAIQSEIDNIRRGLELAYQEDLNQLKVAVPDKDNEIIANRVLLKYYDNEYDKKIIPLEKEAAHAKKLMEFHIKKANEAFPHYRSNTQLHLPGKEEGTYFERLYRVKSPEDLAPKNVNWEEKHWPRVAGGRGIFASAFGHRRKLTTGENVLFIDEMQSTLHQKGSRIGYWTTAREAELQNAVDELSKQYDAIDISSPAGKKKRKAIQEELTGLRFELYNCRKGLPDFPYKTPRQYAGLIIKDMISQAVENDLKGIAWNTAKNIAERYGRLIRDVHWTKANNYVVFFKETGRRGERVTIKTVPQHSLAKYVGEKAASDIMEQIKAGKTTNKLSESLMFDSEHYRNVYDRAAVKEAKKLAKKYGGKVELRTTPIGKDKTRKVWYLEIPEKLKEEVIKRGLPITKRREASSFV